MDVTPSGLAPGVRIEERRAPSLNRIVLHGELGRRFGSEYLWHTPTPAAAIRLLLANFPAARGVIEAGSWRIVRRRGNREIHLDADMLDMGMADAELHLIPVAEGGGNGTLQVILGAVIIVAAVVSYNPELIGLDAGLGVSGATALGIGAIGFSMVLQGIGQLLAPTPRAVDNESYQVAPPNVSFQGGAVPLLFGRARAGSVVASSFMQAIDIALDPNTTATGGGGGSKSGSSGFVEQADTLRSRDQVSFIDVISEGPVQGPATDDPLQSLYFDQTPSTDGSGHLNFKGVTFDYRLGLADQAPMKGFVGASAVVDVGVQVEHDTPITRTITDPTIDELIVTVTFPALYYLDTHKQEMTGVNLEIQVWVGPSGGTLSMVIDDMLSNQKCTSPYDRSYRFPLPPSTTGWDVQVVRVTEDSNDSQLNNQSWWEAYTTIVDGNFTYPNTAYAGISVEAQDFGSNLPNRNYDWYGLNAIEVPSNYDPVAKTYSGVWDGTFKQAWTDCPPWCLRYLIQHPRFGMGDRVTGSLIEPTWLYTIGQYCDQFIDDGFGGTEARWRFNAWINTREEAYSLVTKMASSFRGAVFVGGGLVNVRADMPLTPAKLVTASQVIRGFFNYSGTALSARHNAALAYWTDPTESFFKVPEPYEDLADINQYGYRQTEIQAFGAISRGQAHRTARWFVDTELNQGDVVTYKASYENFLGVGVRDVVKIADPSYQGLRMGGKIVSATANSVTLDAPVILPAGYIGTVDLEVTTGDIGNPIQIVNCELNNAPGATDALTWATPIATLPTPGNAWMLTTSTLAPRQFLLVDITDDEGQPHIKNFTGLFFDPDKFERIEQGIYLEPPAYTSIKSATVQPPTNPSAVLAQVWVNGLPQSQVTLGWTSSITPEVVGYVPSYQTPDGKWTVLSQTGGVTADISPVPVGAWNFSVYAVTIDGRVSSAAAYGPVTFGGKSAAPAAPASIQAVGDQYRQITIEIGASTDSDVAGYVLYESLTELTDPISIEAGQIWQGLATTYVRTGLGMDDGRYYWASALDFAGNESALVGPTFATTAATFPIADLGAAVITDSLLAPDLAATIGLISAPSTTAGSIAQAQAAATAAQATALTAAQFSTKAKADLSQAISDAAGGILALVPQISALSTAFSAAGFVYDTQTGALTYNALAQAQAQNQTVYTSVLAQLSATNASILLKADAATVNSQIAALIAGNQPFESDYFQASADGWTATGANLTTNPASITVTATGTSPLLTKSGLAIPGNSYNQVVMVVRRLDSGTDWLGLLQYQTAGHGYVSAYQQALPVPSAFGAFQTLVWDMSGIADWGSSTVTGLQFALSNGTGDSFEIQSIQISPNTVQQLLLSGLQAQVNSASVAISGLEASVALAASATTVAANTAMINSLQISVDALDSEIALAATTAQLSAVQTQLNDAQLQIDSIQSSITENITSVTVPGAEAAAQAGLLQLINEANQGQAIQGAISQAVNQLTATTANLLAAESSQRLDLQSVVNAASASLSLEQSTRASADNALASSIATLSATVGGNYSTLSTEITTVTGTANTSASQLATLLSNYGGNAGTLAAELTSLASATAANATGIANLSATVGTNYSTLAAEITTVTGTANTSASQLATLLSNYGGNAAALESALSTAASQASTAATELNTLLANYGGSAATLESSLAATASAASASLNALDTIFTSIGGSTAGFVSSIDATATTTGSNASAITALQSQMGAALASVSTNATAIAGVQAEYTIRTQTLSNGHLAIAGIGLLTGAGGQSEVDVLASTFVVAGTDPATGALATISPFFVQGGVVYIQSAMIGALAANKITSGSIVDQDITITGSLTVEDNAGNILFGVGGFANGIIGTAALAPYAASGMSGAITAGAQTIPLDGAWHDVQVLGFSIVSGATGIAISYSAELLDQYADPNAWLDGNSGNNDAGGGSGGGDSAGGE